MERIGRPTRLITFDSESNQRRKAQGEAPIYHFLRPRTLIYVALLVVLSIGTLAALSTRSVVDLNVLHDRNPLLSSCPTGRSATATRSSLLNKQREEATYALALEGCRAR